MMFAVAHDYRLQREDRGFMCAIEVEIGVGIPPPEMEVSRNAGSGFRLQPFVEATKTSALGHSSSVTLSPSPASVSARPLRYEHAALSTWARLIPLALCSQTRPSWRRSDGARRTRCRRG